MVCRAGKRCLHCCSTFTVNLEQSRPHRMSLILPLLVMSAFIVLLYSNLQTACIGFSTPSLAPTTLWSLKANRYESYPEALRDKADMDKVVFLAYVDHGAQSMVYNFYITSIRRHNITNMLFLSSSESLCDEFREHGISCYVYSNDPQSRKESLFGSRDFIQKMNIRTFMILDALQAGYSVLHTDVDMYYFLNPLDLVQLHCNACDIAALRDWKIHNAGFLFIRSTRKSVNVYTTMKYIAENTKKNDQIALNIAIKKGVKKNGLKVKSLPTKEFQCGKLYFQMGRRNFADDNPCPQCVVVHNNWIISMEAKIYRFKEMLMWMYDENGYYSDPSRKYLTYSHESNEMKSVHHWDEQKEALFNALAIGEILNRTVILPRFMDKSKKPANLLAFVNMLKFDEVFRNLYRESTFLSHPLVPSAVANSTSGVIFILNDKLNYSAKSLSKVNWMIEPFDMKTGATSEEILKWFGDHEESILQFHSLHKAYSKFESASQDHAFRQKFKKAF